MKECADFGYDWNGGMGMFAMIARQVSNLSNDISEMSKRAGVHATSPIYSEKSSPDQVYFWDNAQTEAARNSLGVGRIVEYVRKSMGLPIDLRPAGGIVLRMFPTRSYVALNELDQKAFDNRYVTLLKSMVKHHLENPNKSSSEVIKHCIKAFDSGEIGQEVQGSHVLSSTSQPISSSYFNYSPVKDVLLAKPSLPTEIKTITTTITTPTVTTPTVTNTIQQISSTQKVEPEKKTGISLPVVAGVGVLAYLMFSND